MKRQSDREGMVSRVEGAAIAVLHCMNQASRRGGGATTSGVWDWSSWEVNVPVKQWAGWPTEWRPEDRWMEKVTDGKADCCRGENICRDAGRGWMKKLESPSLYHSRQGVTMSMSCLRMGRGATVVGRWCSKSLARRAGLLAAMSLSEQWGERQM